MYISKVLSELYRVCFIMKTRRASNEGNLGALARSRCADNRINLNSTEAGNVADGEFN